MDVYTAKGKFVMKYVLAAALLAAAAPAWAAHEGPASLDAALAQGKREHKPVLVDFQAVWCYSCYFMASHVLNGKEWNDLSKKVIFYEADADKPADQAYMKKWTVHFLPTYVAIGPDGEELGRILAERPRDKFYPEINGILSGDAKLSKLKADATKGSMAAVAEVLETYNLRYAGAEGMAWFETLPPMVRNVSDKDKRVAVAKQRLLLLQAKANKDNAGISDAATRLLAGDIGCDRAYVLDDLIGATETQAADARKALLTPQKATYDQFLTTQVFSPSPACADERSSVLAGADLDAAIGDTAAEQAVLRKGVDSSKAKLHGDLKSDRNAADNLRVYLVRAKAGDELDTLEKQLIAAYPEDYVYNYRYGRRLVESGKAAEGLPYLEAAAKKAYGANRFSVATYRVKALRALNRDDEAKKLVAQTVAADGKAFPEQTKKLEDTLKS
ncbi:thioredoxin family protein [Luteibacter aegosomatissinici]|uniref:thioredoxin family protein n=1 Tax=Luteibacter aegosomatissinici TaxID=2911539 RepID=UPI001FF7E06A|nr:thioredoxin family protein [Luteibacter aegosomatissinici]UPG94955.1 thioredoxin family protein [Luteibacter aegosomatissinici]